MVVPSEEELVWVELAVRLRLVRGELRPEQLQAVLRDVVAIRQDAFQHVAHGPNDVASLGEVEALLLVLRREQGVGLDDEKDGVGGQPRVGDEGQDEVLSVPTGGARSADSRAPRSTQGPVVAVTQCPSGGGTAMWRRAFTRGFSAWPRALGTHAGWHHAAEAH